MPRLTRHTIVTQARRARKPPSFRLELNGRTALVAVATLAAVWLFIHLWPVVLVVLVGLMVVGALNPIVTWLQQRRLKRGYAIALVFAVLLLVSAGFVAITVPKLDLAGRRSDP